MLSINPKDPLRKGTIFRNGTNYTKNSNTSLESPSGNQLISNFSNTLGSKRGDAKYEAIARNLNKPQAIDEQKNFELFMEQMRIYNRKKRIQSIVNLPKKLVPTKPNFISGKLTRNVTKNIRSYVRAEISNIEQGPVSLPIFEERKRICGECPHKKQVKGYKDPLGFCTKCGCGANPRAQLTVKLKLPATSCPLDKWGRIHGHLRRLLGQNKIYTKPKKRKGNLMAEYNRVLPMFAGQGFTQGAAPKGILVTNGEVHCKDRYDTGFTLEEPMTVKSSQFMQKKLLRLLALATDFFEKNTELFLKTGIYNVDVNPKISPIITADRPNTLLCIP